jgi:hypothetical protein
MVSRLNLEEIVRPCGKFYMTCLQQDHVANLIPGRIRVVRADKDKSREKVGLA